MMNFSVVGGPGEGPMRKIARLPKNEQARMEAALAKLIAERDAYAKQNKGNYPSDKQLMESRKKK